VRAVITMDLVRELTDVAAPRAVDVWDTKLPGLVLRVRESGRASYLVVYGRSKKVTIGRADVLKPADARELAQGVLGDVARGKDVQAERRKRRAGTLREFLTEHYEPWVNANRKTGSRTIARIDVFGDEILNRPLAELSSFHVEQWRSRRRRADISDVTINRDLDALRSALSRAVEWQILAAHPLAAVKRKKLDALGRLRYLSAEEERRLRATLEARDTARREKRASFNAWRAARGYLEWPAYGTYTDHLTPIVLLALNTGLRRGELFALRWADVDLVARRVTVRGVSAKTGLTRHVPLNSEAVTALETWRTCAGAVSPASAPIGDDGSEPLVFPGPNGDAMQSLKTAWLKIAKAAELRAFRFHDLRQHAGFRIMPSPRVA
jgi:integrase